MTALHLIAPRPVEPAALREAEIDLANTALARAWHAQQQPMVEPADRDLELALRGSVRITAWRVLASLPLRPSEALTAWWRAACTFRWAHAAYRKRHPVIDISRRLRPAAQNVNAG